MHTIEFTRFTPPLGRQSIETCDVDDEAFAQYQKIISAGFRMTIELLSNGLVSICIEDFELGDYDSVLASNGPQVLVKLKKLFTRFDRDAAERWRTQMRS